jgi:hypothetical protein
MFALRARRYFKNGKSLINSFSSNMPKTPSSSTTSLAPYGILAGLLGLSGYAYYEYEHNVDGKFSKMLRKIASEFNSVLLPASDSLLPDWPTAPCYAGVPPGTPCPPTLIVDVERTLIASQFDTHKGWRHKKRPGVDKFIHQLSSYYEIVLFFETDIGLMEHVAVSLDKENRTHKLGPSAGEVRDGLILKRLDLMNRDMSRIILLDDSEKASQLFPRNTILVKPYTDVYDERDTQLLDLIPVLQSMVHDPNVRDFRVCLDDIGSHQSSEIISEYQMRIAMKKKQEIEKRNKGLGKMIRKLVLPEEEYIPEASPTGVLTSSQIVGSAGLPSERTAESALFNNKYKKEEKKPPTIKKKGEIFDWIDREAKENEEYQMRKQEELNRLYMQKMQEKMKLEQKKNENEN